MKIDIYTLLGMIKDDKTPKKIIYDSKLWEYDNQNKDYFTNHYDGTEWLFDEYVITDILNDKVEILETTITYKQDADYLKPQEPTPYEPYTPPIKKDKIEKINIDIFDDNEITTINKMKHLAIKINQIIDWINKD